MYIVYIIIKEAGGNKYVQGTENTKPQSLPVGHIYYHWDYDESGDPGFPKDADNLIDGSVPWTDSRDYAAQRRAGYKADSDWRYTESRARIKDGEEEATAESDWLAARQNIKNKYPKP